MSFNWVGAAFNPIIPHGESQMESHTERQREKSPVMIEGEYSDADTSRGRLKIADNYKSSEDANSHG